MISEKEYQIGMLDIVKYCCVILILCSHYISEYGVGRVSAIIDYGSSIYIVGVPFFLVCSGYLFFAKITNSSDEEKREKLVKYLKRLFFMYLGWSVIYITFNILTWIFYGIDLNSLLQYIINCFTYSTYQTLWFLPSLCIGVLISFYLIGKFNIKKVLLISFILYVISMLGVSYSFLLNEKSMIILDIYKKYFVSTRNGLFYGVPFVVMGAYIAKYRFEQQENRIYTDCIFSSIFGIAFIIEAVVIKVFFHAENSNTLLMLLPFTYFFFNFCLDIPLKGGKICKYLRKMSMLIFLNQRLYLSAIPGLFPSGIIHKLLLGNPYLAIVILFFLVHLTGILLMYIEARGFLSKSSILKYMI